MKLHNLHCNNICICALIIDFISIVRHKLTKSNAQVKRQVTGWTGMYIFEVPFCVRNLFEIATRIYQFCWNVWHTFLK